MNKTYRVLVKDFSEAGFEKLKRPVTLDGYTIKAPEVKLLQQAKQPDTRAELEVTIHEGRNRQVRRMCAMAGMEVTRLIRVAEGSLDLGDLPLGKWRYLTAAEVEKLKK